MAGFFGFFDYSKPGPGVPENAPPKSPFIVFFEILQRKFWNLVKVNLMFVIFNIPALLLGMFVMLTFFPSIFPDAFESPEMLLNDTILKFILLTVMMCVPMITVGPAQAGFTYIMRNYSREEHAFLWSDFKDAAIKNLKQSLLISTINFLATFMMLFSIRAYTELIKLDQISSIAGTVGLAVMVLLFVVFACMNIYIYPILITFELSVKQLYKNALIFAVIKFLPNIGILLLSAFIVLLSFGMIIPFYPLFGIIPYLLLTVSLIGFLTNFYAYPKLKKYMISRIEEDEEDDDDDDDDEDSDDEEGGVKGEAAAEDTKDNESDDEDGQKSDTGDDGIKRYY